MSHCTSTRKEKRVYAPQYYIAEEALDIDTATSSYIVHRTKVNSLSMLTTVTVVACYWGMLV